MKKKYFEKKKLKAQHPFHQKKNNFNKKIFPK